jgi:Spy/CpxP family protein refolding chaperone
MKHHVLGAKLAVIISVIFISAGAFAMEHGDGDGPHGRHECGCMKSHEGHRGMRFKRFPWMLKRKLGLTGKQAGEISDIMKQGFKTGKPLFESIRTERHALMEVARSGDEAAVRAQAGKLADAEAAMAMHREQYRKKIVAVMTKEQAEKFDKMIAEFKEHKGRHEGKSCDKGHEKGEMEHHQEHHQE